MLDLIFTTSRAGAESFSWPDPFAVISITDPGSDRAAMAQANLAGRINLQFWDLTLEPGDGRPIFTAKMARQVLDFVERDCGRAQLLLIHCEAGISRSTGLGNALGRVLGLDVHHQNAPFLNPNLLVMRVLLKEAGQEDLLL